MTGGELDVNPGSSMGTGDLTMNQHKSRNTAVALSNTAQSIGSLSSIYDGSPINPVTQTITLNGTVLTIHQAVSADYGILPADGATPAGSDSVIAGSGSIVYAGDNGIELSLSDPNNSYTGSTTINSGSLAILTDGNLGAAPASSTPGQLTVNGGQFHATGGAPLTLAATRGFAVGASGGTLLTDAAMPLTIPGVTTFSNSAAAPLIVASNSYVKFQSTANATAVASGASVTVASGATLELAGNASALSDGVSSHVNVVNNSQAAAGGLLATGTNQKVGFVSGTGNTIVAAGSDLTASGIVQNALIIGGSPGNPATLTIRASDSGLNILAGNSTAAETGPGLALAGSAAPASSLATGLSSGSSLLAGGTGLGEGNVVGGSSAAGVNLATGSAMVPEPSALLMLMIGLAGFVGAGFRRRSRVHSVHSSAG
jgi:autotransporter-associated beta strand protein